MAACPLAAERVWIEKSQYQDAEQKYFEHLSKLLKGSSNTTNMPETPSDLNVAKSPMKKVKKNKKEKKEASPSASHEATVAAATVPSASNAKDATVQKTKAKKDKNNKSKQMTKQSTSESLQWIENNKESDEPKECPFQAVFETFTTSKPKKQRKAKKSSKDENSLSEDVTSQVETKMDEVDVKPKDMKDKKSKSEKKKLAKNGGGNGGNDEKSQAGGECTLVNEIAKARQHIKNSLERMDGIAALASTPGKDVLDRIATLEKENASLREIVEQLKKTSLKSEDRISKLESQLQSLSLGKNAQPQPGPAAAAADKSDDDDGVDLFGSDSEDEDEAAAKVREQRLAEYAAKKSKKPVLIAKSNVILDVKPWDDETDMKNMETEVRKITLDGLLWGAAKLVPLAFGIHKLSISCVVEDDKVSIDWLDRKKLKKSKSLCNQLTLLHSIKSEENKQKKVLGRSFGIPQSEIKINFKAILIRCNFIL